MALGDLFGGLGMGLGAAASGALKGQNLGEAEAYRRQQQGLDREYKNAYLASKKKELDPAAKIREQAGRTSQMLTKMLNDPKLQGFYNSAEGKGYAKHLAEQAQRYAHIWLGRVQPNDADAYELTSFWSAEDDEPGSGLGTLPGAGAGASAGGPLGAGLPAPAVGVEVANRLPFLREPGTSQASFEGVPVPRRETPGLAPGTLTAGPPAPPVARPVAPPAPPPETPIQAYTRLANNPPKRVTRPGQLPKDADKEFNDAYKRWQDDLKEARAAVTLADEAAAKKADAKVKETKANYAAKNEDITYKSNVAGRDLKLSQKKQIDVTLPLTAEQKRQAALKAEAERKAIPKKLELQGRSVSAAERQAATGEKRYGLEERKFADNQRRFALLQKKGVTTAAGKALNDRAQRLISLLNAKVQTSGGIEVPQYEDAKRTRWMKELDGILSKMESAGRSSATTTTTTGFKGRADQMKPVLGQVRAAAPKAPPSQRAALMAEMKRRNYSKAKMQRALKDLGL